MIFVFILSGMAIVFTIGFILSVIIGFIVEGRDMYMVPKLILYRTCVIAISCTIMFKIFCVCTGYPKIETKEIVAKRTNYICNDCRKAMEDKKRGMRK